MPLAASSPRPSCDQLPEIAKLNLVPIWQSEPICSHVVAVHPRMPERGRGTAPAAIDRLDRDGGRRGLLHRLSWPRLVAGHGWRFRANPHARRPPAGGVERLSRRPWQFACRPCPCGCGSPWRSCARGGPGRRGAVRHLAPLADTTRATFAVADRETTALLAGSGSDRPADRRVRQPAGLHRDSRPALADPVRRGHRPLRPDQGLERPGADRHATGQPMSRLAAADGSEEITNGAYRLGWLQRRAISNEA